MSHPHTSSSRVFPCPRPVVQVQQTALVSYVALDSRAVPDTCHKRGKRGSDGGRAGGQAAGGIALKRSAWLC